MTFARFERADRNDRNLAVANFESLARVGTFISTWRTEALAIDTAWHDGYRRAIDAGRRERIGDAIRDRYDAIDRAIEQVRRENAIGAVVHAAGDERCRRETVRQRRHRVRARSMEVHDVVALALQNSPEPDGGRDVERVANSQRMTSDAELDRALAEPARRIANQFRTVTCRNQCEGEAEHLSLAAAEPKLGIDAGDADRRRGCGA